MKDWTPEHVRLANAAVQVRDELRRMAMRLPSDMAKRLGSLASKLTAGLKAKDGARSDRKPSPHPSASPRPAQRLPEPPVTATNPPQEAATATEPPPTAAGERYRRQKVQQALDRRAKFDQKKAAYDASQNRPGHTTPCIPPSEPKPGERSKRYLSRNGWRTR